MGLGPPVTPSVVKQLMIANAVVFVAQMMAPSIAGFGAATPRLVWEAGFIWQPFTYMWLHGGLGHVAMNMFALWMFGSPLAMAWGAKRFLRFYLICGVGAGVIIVTYPYLVVAFGVSPVRLMIPTLGASGAVYGVLLAYSLTWPDRTIMLIFPPVAFRAVWLIPLLFGMTFLMDGGRGNVSHIGHLGGVLVGWIYLRRQGETTGKLFSIERLKYRWRRYRMRQRLHAVQTEEQEEWRRRRQKRDHDDPTLH